MNKKLQQGKDYNLDEKGNLIFSKDFLLARGHCCHSGCQNCPYDENHDPETPQELTLEESEEDSLSRRAQEMLEKYDREDKS